MELTLVGIGAGNPAHLTAEAQAAIHAAEIILIPEKAGEKEKLAQLRRDLCQIHADPDRTRIIGFDMPVRDPAVADYKHRVTLWHDAIAQAWITALDGQDAARVVLLVWGDPALYDSSLRIVERLQAQRDVQLRVVPGVMSLQLLTAAHQITLNALAEPFLVTTGRHLRDKGWPVGVDTLVVMLDGDCAFATLAPEGVSIWWGAYLGMAEQILDHGPLQEAGPRIQTTRAAARAVQGWIMDTYLLRREPGQHSPSSAKAP